MSDMDKLVNLIFAEAMKQAIEKPKQPKSQPEKNKGQEEADAAAEHLPGMTKKLYDGFIGVGFTETQALELVKAALS